MYNISCENVSHEECSLKYQNMCYTPPLQLSTNRFIYIKQHIEEKSSHSQGSQKVLVNPHFKTSKVFVNPKFSGVQPNSIHVNPRMNLNVSILGAKQCTKVEPHQKSVTLHSTKIHINPNAKSVQIPMDVSQTSSQTVHINPNFRNQSFLNDVLSNNISSASHTERKENVPSGLLTKAVVLTRTKLIRTPVINNNNTKLRRNSVKSKYKIVKSSLHVSQKKHIAVGNNNEENKANNKYKIDNRRKSLSIITKNQRKYVYVNRFLSISDLAKNCVIKSPTASPIKNTTVVNISGVIYRKSRTSLRRASVTNLSVKKSPNRTVQVSKHKLVKMPALKKLTTCRASLGRQDKDCENKLVLKKFKVVRKTSPKKNKTVKVSPRKLRKCNIPCPYYKKYGSCKGKENGKCFRKHDPDQIALCTRFLQGACIKENCLLSHNVSPEKMPTCKYFLEGTCSRENCPYLHVKISAKAEVCRDFIEGFCKKAAQCDKRHQYLCPDYEKYGNCLKQRCPYPHGKMVRNYLSNKTKFAKKCSDIDKKLTKIHEKLVVSDKGSFKLIDKNLCKNEQLNEKQRYYLEKKSDPQEITVKLTTTGESTQKSAESNDEIGKGTTKNFIGLQSRPKLGSLPAFIPFGN